MEIAVAAAETAVSVKNNSQKNNSPPKMRYRKIKREYNNRRTIKALQTGCGAFVYVSLYGKIILCYHENKRKKCGS